MKLIDGWKQKFLRLWSVRFMLLAIALSGLEVVLPLYVDSFTRGRFALLSFLVTIGALVSRMVAQPKLNDE